PGQVRTRKSFSSFAQNYVLFTIVACRVSRRRDTAHRNDGHAAAAYREYAQSHCKCITITIRLQQQYSGYAGRDCPARLFPLLPRGRRRLPAAQKTKARTRPAAVPNRKQTT